MSFYKIKKSLYEKYHSERKIQRKLIKDNNFAYRYLINVLSQFINKERKILDIGCGVGTIDLYLASKGHKVVGIDISQNALKVAKKNAQFFELNNLQFIYKVFPNETLPERFDIVICSEVLEHLADDSKAINQIYKLVKKGGIAIISTPKKNAPLYKIGLLKNFDKEVGHVRRYTSKQLISMLKNRGFCIVDIIETEGILRNFLFTNKKASKLIKFIKGPIITTINIIDDILLKIFGSSNVYVIVKK